MSIIYTKVQKYVPKKEEPKKKVYVPKDVEFHQLEGLRPTKWTSLLKADRNYLLNYILMLEDDKKKMQKTIKALVNKVRKGAKNAKKNS